MSFASVPAATASAFLYPVALNVRGRRCVIVGGGTVGARKAAALVEAGADVLIIAPDACDAVTEMAARGQIVHRSETFSPEHLSDAFLAIAATDHAEVNQAVANAAHATNILVNLASDSDGGDFATMAAVRRGDLVLGITTGGAGPSLTSLLRQRLEQEFDQGWESYVELLGEMRLTAKRTISDPEKRARALRRLAASKSVREKALAGDIEEARGEAIACLSE